MAEMSRVRSSRTGSQFRGLPSGSTANLATMFLLLSWAVGGGVGMPRGPPPPPQFQDPASLPALDDVAIAEIREQLANADPQEREQRLAFLYQLIQQYMAEAGAGANARMPIPPPLLHSATGVRTHPGHQIPGPQMVAGGDGAGEDDANGDDEGKLKRGSYMSLCHFKICNMGRKRNYRYNQWVRV